MDASQSEAVAGFPLDSPRGQAALTASGLYAAADFFTLVRRDTDPAPVSYTHLLRWISRQ